MYSGNSCAGYYFSLLSPATDAPFGEKGDPSEAVESPLESVLRSKPTAIHTNQLCGPRPMSDSHRASQAHTETPRDLPSGVLLLVE